MNFKQSLFTLAATGIILSGNVQAVNVSGMKENDKNLVEAINAEDLESMQLALEKGANPMTMDLYNFTMLHFAVIKNNINAAMLLIDKDAAVNAQDRFGNTPLHYATEKNNINMAQLLIKKGANPFITNLERKYFFWQLNERPSQIAKTEKMIALLKDAEKEWEKKYKNR
jgi:ankyrin repeat protein